jgi:regulator of sigma E protease
MCKGFIGRAMERFERAIVLLFILHFLIFVHECGHLLVGKAFGIATLSFNVGFGPAFRSYTGPETIYSLRYIPLGGYVEFFQRDRYDPESLQNYIKEIEELRPQRAAMLNDPSRDLRSTSRYQLILMLLAGPAVNLIVGRWCIRWSRAIYLREHQRFSDRLGRSPGDFKLLEQYMHFVSDFSVGHLSRVHTHARGSNSRLRLLFSIGGPVSVIRQLWISLEVYHRRPLYGILRAMGPLSMGLGIVNLLPIPPLDGGRILLVLVEGGVSPESTLTILLTAVSALGFLGLILLGDTRVLYGWVRPVLNRIFRRR